MEAVLCLVLLCFESARHDVAFLLTALERTVLFSFDYRCIRQHALQ